MEITWLTQGGFLFTSQGKRLLVDPYLSDFVERNHDMTRIAEFPLSVEELKPDCVFCTHDHIDHLDPEGIPQIARAYPECVFMGPQSVVQHYKKLGIESNRIQELTIGDSQTLGPIKITVTQAEHGDDYAVGLIIRTAEQSIYLSGDTLKFETLCDHIKSLAKTKLDCVLICINGKWGNMSLDEALEVVESLQPRLAIPMHYGLFAENTVDPKPFIDQCSTLGIAAQELTIGVPFVLESESK